MRKDAHFIDLESGRFFYLERGKPRDPVVICLHGFPDHPPTFLPVMKHLAAGGYRVIAPWMRGYAPSTLSGPFNVDRLTKDLLETVEALSPKHPVALLGHDWGAIVTHAAAIAEPARFHAAVALSVPHPLTLFAALRSSPAQVRRSWYTLFFQLPWLPERILMQDDLAFIDRLWQSWSPGVELSEEERRELKRCLSMSFPAPIEYYRALVPAVLRATINGLPKTELPFLYLHGRNDGCIAPEVARGQERHFDGPFESRIIEDAGHFLHVEVPEEVGEATVQWLKRYPRLGA